MEEPTLEKMSAKINILEGTVTAQKKEVEELVDNLTKTRDAMLGISALKSKIVSLERDNDSLQRQNSTLSETNTMVGNLIHGHQPYQIKGGDDRTALPHAPVPQVQP